MIFQAWSALAAATLPVAARGRFSDSSLRFADWNSKIAKRDDELLRIERLCQNPDARIRGKAPANSLVSKASRKDNRKIGAQLTHLGDQFITGFVRQPKIDDGACEPAADILHPGHGLAEAACLLGSASRSRESVDHEHAQQRFIFHDKDACVPLAAISVKHLTDAGGQGRK